MARYPNVRATQETKEIAKEETGVLERAVLRLSEVSGSIARKAAETKDGRHVHGWLYRETQRLASLVLQGASWLVAKIDQFIKWFKEQWQTLQMTKRIKESAKGFWEGVKAAWEGFFHPEERQAA